MLSGVENVTGSDFDDVLLGDDGPNVLRARIGVDLLDGRGDNDVLHGGSGDDLLAGGPGDDTLVGNNGVDVADYSSAPGPVDVNLSTGVATGASEDSLSGILAVFGSPFNDVIVGGSFVEFPVRVGW